MFLHHWTYTAGANEAKVHEMYHDDAILEFPQSGERFRGKANIQGFREEYPAVQSTSSRARSGEAGTSGSGRAGRCMTAPTR